MTFLMRCMETGSKSEQGQERKRNAKKTAPEGCQKAKRQNYN